MERNSNDILNEDLERLERKIALIGMSDPEKYKFYMNRLKAIQSRVLGTNEREFENIKFSIIQEMTSLQVDFDGYMTGSDTSELTGQELSGKSKMKKYKIGLYQGIVADLKKLDEIDINRLRQLREKWEEEKKDEYVRYQAIEISVVEEALSDAFLEYQIKYAKKNKNLPDDKITDYVSKEEYSARIQEKLISISQNENLSAAEKLEISELANIKSLDDLLKNKRFWEIITSSKLSVDQRKVDKMLGTFNEKEEEKNESSNLPMVIEEPKKGKLYALGVIKKKGLFGREVEKKVKIKIKDTSFYLPERYRDKLVAITIPEGVTRIGYAALSECPLLEKVSLPSTLERIGKNAFEGSLGLTEIDLPDSVKVIEEFAFRNCENLEKINLHAGIERIEDYAFENSGLREVNLADNDFSKQYDRYFNNNFRVGAFKNCKKLERVVLPKNHTFLSSELFKGCESLTEIIFPENLEYIGEYVFHGCTSLTEVMDLPETVERMDRDCFSECPNLKKFRLPSFLRELGFVFDSNVIFDEFILPKQLMNLKILDDLRIKDTNVVTIPDDAQGYLYDKLNLTGGDQISLLDLRFMIAENNAKEVEIEPETETYLKHGPRNKFSVRTRVKVPPTIVAVEGKEILEETQNLEDISVPGPTDSIEDDEQEI